MLRKSCLIAFQDLVMLQSSLRSHGVETLEFLFKVEDGKVISHLTVPRSDATCPRYSFDELQDITQICGNLIRNTAEPGLDVFSKPSWTMFIKQVGVPQVVLVQPCKDLPPKIVLDIEAMRFDAGFSLGEGDCRDMLTAICAPLAQASRIEAIIPDTKFEGDGMFHGLNAADLSAMLMGEDTDGQRKLEQVIEEALFEFPPLGPVADTPLKELVALREQIKRLAGAMLVQFDGGSAPPEIYVERIGTSRLIPKYLQDRIVALAPVLIACEIPDWNIGRGAVGSLSIDADQVYLKADDNNADWACDDTVEVDLLLPDEWPVSEGTAPASIHEVAL